MNRREFLHAGLKLGVLAASASISRSLAATKNRFDPEMPLIAAPRDKPSWSKFRRQLAAWREQRRQDLDYSDAHYQRPEFAWANRCFSCCFLMLCDQAFYDRLRGQYTVGKFLKHGHREFGGFDAVVLWHAYPRIGFDERNQFDFYREMPGGLTRLRQIARNLHARGVRCSLVWK